MQHRICVFNSNAISAAVFAEDAHKVIVMISMRPIALKLQHGRYGRHPHGSGLRYARQRGNVSRLGSTRTSIFDNVNVVAFSDHVKRWPGDTDLSPKAGQNDVLFAGRFNCVSKGGGVPRVHSSAFNWL